MIYGGGDYQVEIEAIYLFPASTDKMLCVVAGFLG